MDRIIFFTQIEEVLGSGRMLKITGFDAELKDGWRGEGDDEHLSSSIKHFSTK